MFTNKTIGWAKDKEFGHIYAVEHITSTKIEAIREDGDWIVLKKDQKADWFLDFADTKEGLDNQITLKIPEKEYKRIQKALCSICMIKKGQECVGCFGELNEFDLRPYEIIPVIFEQSKF